MKALYNAERHALCFNKGMNVICVHTLPFFLNIIWYKNTSNEKMPCGLLPMIIVFDKLSQFLCAIYNKIKKKFEKENK